LKLLARLSPFGGFGEWTAANQCLLTDNFHRASIVSVCGKCTCFSRSLPDSTRKQSGFSWAESGRYPAFFVAAVLPIASHARMADSALALGCPASENRMENRRITEMFKQYDAGKGKRKWDVGDCTVRALSTALGVPYSEAWELLYKTQGEHRACSFRVPEFLKRDPERFGVRRYIPFPARPGQPRMTGRDFCKRFPKGDFIVRMAHHVAAVENGVLYDLFDSTRKCVYGAWEVSPTAYKTKRTALTVAKETVDESDYVEQLTEK
jgi:hypothetical protein